MIAAPSFALVMINETETTTARSSYTVEASTRKQQIQGNLEKV